jgi:anti-sigma factor RsiW
MKCERIQDLILTDYLDGQLSADQARHIDGHLAQCAACAAFAQTARAAAFEPFRHAGMLTPPDAVWMNIKESIAVQEERSNVFAELWEKVRSLSAFPKPAFAVATVLALLLGTAVFNPVRLSQEASVTDQGEYLDSLSTVPGELSFNEGSGFDTAVERYFL